MCIQRKCRLYECRTHLPRRVIAGFCIRICAEIIAQRVVVDADPYMVLPTEMRSAEM